MVKKSPAMQGFLYMMWMGLKSIAVSQGERHSGLPEGKPLFVPSEGVVQALPVIIQDVVGAQAYFGTFFSAQGLGKIKIQTVERFGIDIGVLTKPHDFQGLALYIVEKSCLDPGFPIVIVQTCIDQVGGLTL